MSNVRQGKKLRVVFMGTPEFSVPGLARLIAAPEFEVVGVFTQPDKPVGRKQVMTPPPVKELAAKHGIPVFQPEKIKPETEAIRNLRPDLIVVIAYGKIIPQAILDIPAFGCVNVHASLLPKYRGAACLNAPILSGDKETGVTVMLMEAGLDTGPILRQAKLPLSGTETLAEVHDKLSSLGAEMLLPTLLDHVDGKIEPQRQDDSQASYIPTLKKEDGRIDFHKDAIEIERMVRAYNPWPGTFMDFNGEIVKITAVEHGVISGNQAEPGQLYISGGRLLLQCGQNSLVVLRLQLAGKKEMDSKGFINGYKTALSSIG